MLRYLVLPAVVLAAVTVAVGPTTARPARAQSGDCAVAEAELTVDGEEQAALAAINAVRAGSGLPALSLSPALGRAAAWKSVAMAATGIFDHSDPGRGFAQRLRDCGYPANTWIGETLAMGMEGGRAAVNGWVGSPPHWAIMMSGQARAVGVARARGPRGWYWTAAFGGIVDAATPSAPVAPPPGAGPATAPSLPAGGGSRATLPGPSEDPCLPPPGLSACDAFRVALWRGDVEAWLGWYAALGLAAPDRAQIFLITLRFRADNGSIPSNQALATLAR